MLSGIKCTIISTGVEGIWGNGSVAPLCKLERIYTLAQSIPGETQTSTS